MYDSNEYTYLIKHKYMSFFKRNKTKTKTKTARKRKSKTKQTSKNSQIVICNECYSEFTALTEKVKRGNAKFCTRSCSAKYTIKSKKSKLKTCRQCAKRFRTKNSNAKYCSIKCSGRNSTEKRKLTSTQKEKVTKLKKRGCEICNWKKASCDIHHMTPISKGGTNRLSNLITLCPNHHRIADQEIIPIIRLIKLIRIRRKEIGF